MKRRSFLKSLSIVPAFGFFPSFSSADELAFPSDGSDVVGLNKIIEIVQKDKRLNQRTELATVELAIETMQEMNRIIIEAIIQTGVGNDKKISTADTREINDYIFYNFQEEWIEWHSIFSLIVNSGARTLLFGKNAIDIIANSIYHLGFESHTKNNLANESGESDGSYKQVAYWLDNLLREDLEAGRLFNPEIQEVIGESGTGLDRVVEIIYSDEGLQRHISTGDMRIGATSANTLNRMLLEAIEETNAGASGAFTTDNMHAINNYLVSYYTEAWATAHGSDKENSETGYHKVKNDGAIYQIFDKNAINSVFEGIYQLGFVTPDSDRTVNEEDTLNNSFEVIALWLTQLLGDELNNDKEDLKILIPLYSYPNIGEDVYVWQKIIDTQEQYPDAEIVAIVNPSNGHFTEEDSNYTQGIQDLISANIKVIGYVYTQYGERATEEIVADLDAWEQFYKDTGVSGIFFDETSTDATLLSFYENLTNEARNRGFDFTILNAGTTTDQSYIDSGIASLVVTYENQHETLLSNPPSTYNDPSSSTELSLLIYEMEGDSVDDLIAFAREHQFGYIYFTEDGADGNPWDSTSIYIEDEVAKALA
jgi:hypothetical protein